MMTRALLTLFADVHGTVLTVCVLWVTDLCIADVWTGLAPGGTRGAAPLVRLVTLPDTHAPDHRPPHLAGVHLAHVKQIQSIFVFRN